MARAPGVAERLRRSARAAADRLVLPAENRLVGLDEQVRRWRSDGPTIGYVGYTWGRNLGDSACLLAARRLLPGATVVDWCRSWPGAVRRRASFDAAMVGGGTLIGRAGWLDEFQSIATSPGAPTFLIGTGVEDPESEAWGLTEQAVAERWAPVLREMAHLSVRGERSAAILRELYGLEAPAVGDLALALEAPASDPLDKVLGVCLGVPGDGMWGTSQQVMEASLEVGRALLDEGWRLRIITVWPLPDRSFNDEFARLLGRPDRVSVSTCTTAEPFMDAVGGCTVLLAERLHALVLASVAGVPSVAMAYRPKTEEFMASIDRSDWCVRTSAVDGDVLLDQVRALADGRDAHASQIRDAVAARRSALEGQAASIGAMLRDRPPAGSIALGPG